MPYLTANIVKYDFAFWNYDAIGHPKLTSITGLYHFSQTLTACNIPAYA
jgi:hypothetical protein